MRWRRVWWFNILTSTACPRLSFPVLLVFILPLLLFLLPLLLIATSIAVEVIKDAPEFAAVIQPRAHVSIVTAATGRATGDRSARTAASVVPALVGVIVTSTTAVSIAVIVIAWAAAMRRVRSGRSRQLVPAHEGAVCVCV